MALYFPIKPLRSISLLPILWFLPEYAIGQTEVDKNSSDNTAFLTSSIHSWSADAGGEAEMGGTSIGLSYTAPASKQRADFDYANNPITFVNSELYHPKIRDWRLNENSISLGIGEAKGKGLEEFDENAGTQFFQIDNQTRYVQVEGRYWISQNIYGELGVTGSQDKFNGIERSFRISQSFQNPISSFTYTPFDNSMQRAIFNSDASNNFFASLANADDFLIGAQNMSFFEVSAPNGDNITIYAGDVDQVFTSIPNGDNFSLFAEQVGSINLDLPNGDDGVVLARNVGNLDFSFPNGDNWRIEVQDGQTLLVDAPNGDNINIAFDGNNVPVVGPQGAISANVSGSLPQNFATNFGASIPSEFNEIDGSDSALLVAGGGCRLFVNKTDGRLIISSASREESLACLQTLTNVSAGQLLSQNEDTVTSFFRKNSETVTGKARLGIKSPGLMLGRLSNRINESFSGGLTYERSPQGNGIGRAGSWADIEYKTALHIHNRPSRTDRINGVNIDGKLQNPFPRMIEANIRHVREISQWNTTWTEVGINMYGSFNPPDFLEVDSNPRLRHYSLGFKYVDFNKDDDELEDFRIDNRESSFSIATANVDVLNFKSWTLGIGYRGSNIKFKALDSGWVNNYFLNIRTNRFFQ